MIERYGRSLYQKTLINPTISFFSSLSPATITIYAIVSGICVLPLIALHQTIPALAMLLLSGFLDTLDGSVARFKNKTSQFGAVLDITGDRLVEFCVILGLYLYDPETRSMNCLLMLGSVLLCVTSFLVVGIFTPNQTDKGFHYSPGLMERAEAFIFFFLMIVCPPAFSSLSYLFSALVFLTAFVRLWEFKRFSS